MSSLRFRYQTIEVGAVDIHLRTLRDKQQYYDPLQVAEKLGICSASWSLFGVVWPSSQVLANQLLNYDIANKRILEIGCGIGLTSLLLNKLDADITATDYHPEVEGFLQANAALNGGEAIAFERLDWKETTSGLGQFDLIVGSDLLYEDQHIDLLSGFIEQHANPHCEVLLVDPARGRKNKFTARMHDYGYQHEHVKLEQLAYLPDPYKGHVLSFCRA